MKVESGEIWAEKMVAKDQEIERLKADINELINSGGASFNKLRQHVTALESLLEKVPHDRKYGPNAACFVCADNCPACAYEALKKEGK